MPTDDRTREAKIRERFEEWAETKPLVKGLIQPFLRLRADENRYFYSRVDFAWQAYDQGREDEMAEAQILRQP